jgi:hypothetical protein
MTPIGTVEGMCWYVLVSLQNVQQKGGICNMNTSCNNLQECPSSFTAEINRCQDTFGFTLRIHPSCQSCWWFFHDFPLAVNPTMYSLLGYSIGGYHLSTHCNFFGVPSRMNQPRFVTVWSSGCDVAHI